MRDQTVNSSRTLTMDVSLETVPCIVRAVTDMIATASQVPGCLEQLMQYWRNEKAVCLDLISKHEKEAMQGKPLANVIISYCSIPMKEAC
jgi:hypothetical protein